MAEQKKTAVKKAAPKKPKAEKPAVLTGTVPEWSSTGVIAQMLGFKGCRRVQQLTQDGVLETEIPPGGGARKYRTCETIQAVLHAYKRNVVGKGYTLRAATGNDSLDKQIEKAWKRWCKARNCDVTGEQSFNEILRMMVERKKVDGGMIVLYRYTPGGVVPFKLQCLEVDELDKTQATPRHKGNRVVGGIEYNQYRRPVGYWIRQYDIEGWQLAEPAYIEAKDVFFYKSKHRPRTWP